MLVLEDFPGSFQILIGNVCNLWAVRLPVVGNAIWEHWSLCMVWLSWPTLKNVIRTVHLKKLSRREKLFPLRNSRESTFVHVRTNLKARVKHLMWKGRYTHSCDIFKPFLWIDVGGMCAGSHGNIVTPLLESICRRKICSYFLGVSRSSICLVWV